MKTIYGIESESRKLEKIKKTIREAKNCFGEGEFTRKDYKRNISYNLLTLETLRKKRLLKVVRKEYFDVKINDNYTVKECLVNNRGEVIQSKYSYTYREKRLAEELGFKVETREFENEIVKGVRYFYKVDFDRFEDYVTKRVEYLKINVNHQINQAKNVLNRLRDLEIKLDY